MFIESIILMTKIKMKLPNIAVLKLLYNRARADFQVIPTVLSFLIADAVGIDMKWWYFVLILGFFLIHILWSLDRGVRQEQDFHWRKSTEWQEMKRKIDTIYRSIYESKENETNPQDIQT